MLEVGGGEVAGLRACRSAIRGVAFEPRMASFETAWVSFLHGDSADVMVRVCTVPAGEVGEGRVAAKVKVKEVGSRRRVAGGGRRV